MLTQGSAASSEPTTKRKDGRGNHLWNHLRQNVPPKLAAYPTLLDRAARVLFPWSPFDYPGVQAGMSALISRVATDTVRSWRRGRRRTPQWVWPLIIAETDRRIAALEHIRALAKKEAGL